MSRLEVIKRDGRVVGFDNTKISNAIRKSFLAAYGKECEELSKIVTLVESVQNSVELIYGNNNRPTVEQIQDIVESTLMSKGYNKAAKSYMIYRAERTRSREMNGSLMQVMEQLTKSESDQVDLKRENANIDGNTAMGTMLRYGSEVSKHYIHMSGLDKEFSDAHKSGDIHIHDLDFYNLTMTCVQLDLEKLFKDGFGTGHGVLREPNDIRSYSALACIAIQSSQNDMHGGQSIPALDYYLAPGVLKTFKKSFFSNIVKGLVMRYYIGEEVSKSIIEETLSKIEGIRSIKLTYRDKALMSNEMRNIILNKLDKVVTEVELRELIDYVEKISYDETNKATYQAMEAMIANLNTMQSRAGSQVPFSSVNYGTDITPEGRMVIENILLTTEKGLGNNETPIFPIQIFKTKSGINLNEGEPNYDLFKLACRVSSKRLFPNFSFLDAPFNLQYYEPGKVESEIAYMGCRTRVIANVNDRGNEVVTGRGNLSFTSINLPRIALEVGEGNIEEFYSKLNERLDLTVEQLNKRMKVQGAKKVKNLPFLMGQGVWKDSENLGWEDTVEEVIRHGTLSVGFIGLAEALTALTGKHHGESEDSQKLGLEIISHMRKYLDELAEKTKLNYSLIATPAEGLAGRFVKMDRERFGKISGVTDREYYTNSFHVPVHHRLRMFEKIDIEAPYHALTNAGHISYVELDGNAANNLEAFEKLIKYMAKSGIGYGSINHPVDRDPVCGYTGIIDDHCPKCGRSEDDGNLKFERIRRITGYLVGTLDRFNNAKQSEEKDRVKHSR